MRSRVRYLGRVQGVGFRATAQGIAAHRPVTGWVKNEFDGSVVMEVQGTPEAIEDVLASIRQQMARNITRHERAEIDEQPDEQGFTIRRG